MERLRALADAARDLAHELKNQLTAAIGSAAVVLDSLTDPTAKQDLRNCLAALERIAAPLTLVQRLLRGEGESCEFELAAATTDIVTSLEPFLADRGRPVDIAQPEPVLVLGDPDGLSSFLATLLTVGGSGPVVIRVRSVEAGADARVHGSFGEVELTGEFTVEQPQWSVAGEQLALRALGGDLVIEEKRIAVWLPVAGAIDR